MSKGNKSKSKISQKYIKKKDRKQSQSKVQEKRYGNTLNKRSEKETKRQDDDYNNTKSQKE